MIEAFSTWSWLVIQVFKLDLESVHERKLEQLIQSVFHVLFKVNSKMRQWCLQLYISCKWRHYIITVSYLFDIEYIAESVWWFSCSKLNTRLVLSAIGVCIVCTCGLCGESQDKQNHRHQSRRHDQSRVQFNYWTKTARRIGNSKYSPARTQVKYIFHCASHVARSLGCDEITHIWIFNGDDPDRVQVKNI